MTGLEFRAWLARHYPHTGRLAGHPDYQQAALAFGYTVQGLRKATRNKGELPPRLAAMVLAINRLLTAGMM